VPECSLRNARSETGASPVRAKGVPQRADAIASRTASITTGSAKPITAPRRSSATASSIFLSMGPSEMGPSGIGSGTTGSSVTRRSRARSDTRDLRTSSARGASTASCMLHGPNGSGEVHVRELPDARARALLEHRARGGDLLLLVDLPAGKVTGAPSGFGSSDDTMAGKDETPTPISPDAAIDLRIDQRAPREPAPAASDRRSPRRSCERGLRRGAGERRASRSLRDPRREVSWAPRTA
jgi:hypothetical protein